MFFQMERKQNEIDIPDFGRDVCIETILVARKQ
jgi:hypothetical protein